MFEALKFRYFGPIDGHDVMHLTRVLEDLKTIPGPKLLHCITVKGKGFPRAEEQQTVFHAPGKFDKCTGELIKPASVPSIRSTRRFLDIRSWNWHGKMKRSWE
jgi:1-deoxy-D-xylulose-5-phosphate synthase